MLTLDGYKVSLDSSVEIFTMVAINNGLTGFGVNRTVFKQLYQPNPGTGKGCFCEEITFCPHTNVTHIESIAHLKSDTILTITRIASLPPLLMTIVLKVNVIDGQVCTLPPITDHPLMSRALITGLILHTGWLDKVLSSAASPVASSATSNNQIINVDELNPPFVSPNVIKEILLEFPNIQVLGIDSISLDPINDGGVLAAHWAYFENDSTNRLLMELCRIPTNESTNLSGVYALQVNAAAFNSDAIPCRPVLYPIREEC